MNTNTRRALLAIAVLALWAKPAVSQISITFDGMPYTRFADPVPDIADTKMATSATTFEIGFPFALSERTRLDVAASWKRTEFSYRDYPVGGTQINSLHQGQLSFTLMRQLSDRWMLMAVATPGLASDLHGDLDAHDFNYQAILAFIKTASPKWTYGFGVVYATQFGKPIPLPVALVERTFGDKVTWTTLLPISSELWVAQSDRFHYGVSLTVDGNLYQGDPDRFEVDDPELQYSVVTVGPSARIGLGSNGLMQIDAGFVPYNRFEFFDGDDKVATFDLESAAFARLKFQYGR